MYLPVYLKKKQLKQYSQSIDLHVTAQKTAIECPEGNAVPIYSKQNARGDNY